MIPHGLYLLQLFPGQLQQTQPLSDPVGGEAMPFGKLFPGQVVPEHLLLELLGVDDGVAVAFWCRAVSTYIAWCYELDDRQIGGSNRHCVGVPPVIHPCKKAPRF